jgi:hypothetical protein
VAVVPGNVTAAFAALSTLTVTVTADPDRCPDLPALERHLRRELEGLTAALPTAVRGGGPGYSSGLSGGNRSGTAGRTVSSATAG